MRIRKFFRYYFLAGHVTETDPNRIFKLRMLTSFNFLAAFVTTVFAIIYFKKGLYSKMAVDLAFMIGSFTCHWVLSRNKNNYRPCARYILISLNALLVALGVQESTPNSGILLWYYTTPALCFLLMGRREGLIWALTFVATLAGLLLRPQFMGLEEVYAIGYIVRFTFSITVISVSCQFYENHFSKLRLGLLEANNEVKRQNKQVLEGHKNLNSVLNSLHEGVLLMDEEGKCLDIYSKSISHLLECPNPTGMSFSEVLKLDEQGEKDLKEWLELINKDIIPFEDAEKLAPLTYSHSEENKRIRIAYRPIYDDNIRILTGLVAVVSDVTDEFTAKKNARKLEQQSKMILRITGNRDLFHHYIDEVADFSKKLFTWIEKPNEDQITEFKHELHTLTGGAAFLHIESLRHIFLEQEQIIKLELQSREYTTDYHKNVLMTFRNKLQDVLTAFHKNFEELHGKKIEEDKNILEIERQKLLLILKSAQNQFESAKTVNWIKSRIFKKDISQLLAHFEDFTFDQAKKFKKEVHSFEFKGDEIYIDQQNYDNIFKNFVHLFSNIVAHGLEYPEKRQEQGKNSGGQVVIESKHLGDDGFRVIVSDDGSGISLDRIKAKMSELNISFENMSEKQILNTIFSQEFSTAGQVTEISGRGIGLNALLLAVEKAGGNIDVETKENQGTSFIITIPYIEGKQSHQDAA